MDGKIVKSSSQAEIGTSREFNYAVASGWSRTVDSTQGLPVLQIISDELSEVFGNQGLGTWAQSMDIETGTRTALAECLANKLALTPEAQQSELENALYFSRPLCDAKRVEQESMVSEPMPLHLATNLGGQAGCFSLQGITGKCSSVPSEGPSSLPMTVNFSDALYVDGGSVSPSDHTHFCSLEMGNYRNLGLQQEPNGLSTPSLLGSTRYHMENGEVLPIVPPTLGSQRTETRGKSCSNETDHAKRSHSILPCDLTNERSRKDHSMSSRGFSSNPKVLSWQTDSHAVQSHTQGIAILGQPSEQRVRACRGQATDPHSISERMRRVKISERLKTLQSLVPDSNKTDKASVLDEIIDHVKLLQLQVQIFTMSRIGGSGASAVAPFITDSNTEGPQNIPGAAGCSQDIDMAEKMVVDLLKDNVGAGLEYLENQGLCLIPISQVRRLSDTGSGSRLIYSETKNTQKDKKGQHM